MKNIALIFGGPSAEHDVSVVSARNIYEVLESTEHKVFLLGVTRNKEWKLIPGEDLKRTSFQSPLNLDEVGSPVSLSRQGDLVKAMDLSTNQDIDTLHVAFPIIHGPYGEDGKLQGHLDALGLPYVGSDTTSCAICMDKVVAKDMVAKTDILQGPYLSARDSSVSFEQVTQKLKAPLFIKPANMGSSVGIRKVKSEQEFAPAVAEAFKYDRKIIIEQGIEGREIECAILEKNGKLFASGVGEVAPNHEFYTYDAKYIDPDGADLIIPADVPDDVVKKIQGISVQVFKLLGCRDFARVDFFLTKEGQIFLNEINTHPGFTNISQYPLLWKEAGTNYEELVLQLIDNALKRT